MKPNPEPKNATDNRMQKHVEQAYNLLIILNISYSLIRSIQMKETGARWIPQKTPSHTWFGTQKFYHLQAENPNLTPIHQQSMILPNFITKGASTLNPKPSAETLIFQEKRFRGSNLGNRGLNALMLH